MSWDHRRGSDSRCCNPDLAPLHWHDYTDADHPSCKEFDEWLANLMPVVRAHELGEIDELLEAASRGELQESADSRTPIKPIWREPEIFELRRKALSKQLRFYHGEPAEWPGALVKVHRHIKSDAKTQKAEIAHAADRYERGRPDLWQ